MHLHWERSNNSEGDCAIQALSWMGKVPEEIPEVIILKKNLAKICKIVKYIVINFRYFVCPDSKCVSFRRMGGSFPITITTKKADSLQPM
jgi:hypothetical protein